MDLVQQRSRAGILLVYFDELVISVGRDLQAIP